MRKAFYAVLLLGLGAALLPAQTMLTSTVYMALTAKNEWIRPALQGERATAVTADGRIWAVSYWMDRTTTTAREMRLFASADGGSTWKYMTKTRTGQGTYGSIVTDPDGTTLHVAFQSRPASSTGSDWSIYYAPFDTTTDTWAAADTTVFTGGTNSRPIIAVNSRGTLLVGTLKSSGWSTYFKIYDGQKWSGETKLQGGSYSKCPCVLVGPDDCFHFAYQSTGTYTAYYRRYDPFAAAFGKEGEILVQARIANDMSFALTPDGDIFLCYITSLGSAGQNPGSIQVSHGKIGTWQFTHHTIYTDTTSPHCLSWGNYNFYNFNFSRSGPDVSITYTIPVGTPTSKTYDNMLYIRDWTGQGFTPQRTLYTGPPNSEVRFHMGRAAMDCGKGMMIPFSLYLFDTATPPNQIAFAMTVLYEPGAFVPYGRACETSAKELPQIGAAHYPHLGNSKYALTLGKAIGGGGAVLLIGTSMTAMGPLPLPFDLSPLGITGCYLHTDILVSPGTTVGTGGEASVQLPVPNIPVLKGSALTGQWVFLDSSAPGSLRFTSGGITYLW